MLRAASGLGDSTLQPWLLRAHYKTYDAYGKPKANGILEYMWAGPRKWHSSYTEGATVVSRWQAGDDFYTLPDQSGAVPYPASLILGQILHPLGFSEKDAAAPASYTTEKFGSVSASCFTADADPQQTGTKLPELKRACTVLHRPILALRLGSYTVSFQQPIAFQHKITGKTILIKYGSDSVVDIGIDLLRTANSEELKSVEPPTEAVAHHRDSEAGVGSVTAGAITYKAEPSYPEDAKRRRIQGTVHLSETIGVDGHTKNLVVLHSPDPELTDAAEDAVKHWVYAPALLRGKPVEVNTQVTVTFVLSK